MKRDNLNFQQNVNDGYSCVHITAQDQEFDIDDYFLNVNNFTMK